MKKLLTYIGLSALLVVSCTQFEEPNRLFDDKRDASEMAVARIISSEKFGGVEIFV